MQTLTPLNLWDATPLLPWMVAERLLPHPTDPISGASHAQWVDYLSERANYHFQHHKHFHKLMMGRLCLEYLEAFMVHWINAGEVGKANWERNHNNKTKE